MALGVCEPVLSKMQGPYQFGRYDYEEKSSRTCLNHQLDRNKIGTGNAGSGNLKCWVDEDWEKIKYRYSFKKEYVREEEWVRRGKKGLSSEVWPP
jgi:hypothetical protein